MESFEEMEFTQAWTYFMNDNFNSAWAQFTSLVTKYPAKDNYLLYRASCYLKIKNYEKCFNDVDLLLKTALGNTMSVLFLKGVCLFFQNNYVESKIALTSAVKAATTNEERNRLVPWMNKVNIEWKDTGVIDYNAPSTDLKIINNWIQSGKEITLEMTGNHNLNQYDISIERKIIKFVSKADQKAKYLMELTNSVVPEKSTFKVNGMKVEMKLVKEVENFNWITLEANSTSNTASIRDKPVNGVYPTSSKVKKDWNQWDKELENEFKEDAKNDSNEGMWTWFRDIYSKGDEKTRQAMIKSFQTSGGTVLSTNYDEVINKDYEGKDRPEAPKGQEWAKKE